MESKDLLEKGSFNVAVDYGNSHIHKVDSLASLGKSPVQASACDYFAESLPIGSVGSRILIVDPDGEAVVYETAQEEDVGGEEGK